MSLRVKRVLNAFLIGSLGFFLLLGLEDWQNLTDAVRVGDWASLKVAGLSLIGGAIVAGFRAAQAYAPAVPSPEPSENPPAK